MVENGKINCFNFKQITDKDSEQLQYYDENNGNNDSQNEIDSDKPNDFNYNQLDEKEEDDNEIQQITAEDCILYLEYVKSIENNNDNFFEQINKNTTENLKINSLSNKELLSNIKNKIKSEIEINSKPKKKQFQGFNLNSEKIKSDQKIQNLLSLNDIELANYLSKNI